MTTNRKSINIASVVLLILVVLLCIAISSTYISLDTIILVLLNKIFGIEVNSSVSESDIIIVWALRVPRVILACLVGASLAVSGTAVQSVLRNPLASPYTIGVSSGACLGVALAIIFKVDIPIIGIFTIPIIGLISGLVTVGVILALVTAVDDSLSNNTIILVGMVSSLFVNGILTLVISLAHDNIESIIVWQMGSLSLKGWNHVLALLPFFIIGMSGIIYYSREMDALSYGEDHALSVGVNAPIVKRNLLIFSTILTGSAIALTGIIGFIGLVAPHIVRKIVGPKHLQVIFLSSIFGAIFLLLSDLVSRTIIAPASLPVGAVTSLIGAPFFAFIFFKKRG